MGNVPVIHEAATCFQSLGDVIAGDTKNARKRWEDYSEASVIGSGVKSAACAIDGDMESANRLVKAMGRATGSALLLGGAMRNVPVFHELATCGDSLGDMIGGGDDVAARKRWVDYSESSVIGSGTRACIALCNNDMKEAARLGKVAGMETASGAVALAALGATFATCGALAPAGVLISSSVGGVVCASVGATEVALENLIRGSENKAGDLIGSALMGGAGGAAAGIVEANSRVKGRSMKRYLTKAVEILDYLDYNDYDSD